MHRPPARQPVRFPARRAPAARTLASMPALALALAAPPLAAQQTFSLPPASSSPTPAPAGPADERAGVAIPPRPVATAAPTAAPSPQVQPLAIPSATATPQRTPAPRAGAYSATATPPAAVPVPGPATAGPEAAQVPQAPSPAASDAAPPLASAPSAPEEATDAAPFSGWPLPEWWPLAASTLAALLALGGFALVQRRRKAKPLRLAAPGADTPAAGSPPASSPPPRLDLALEITAATRSLMMFTLEYRLTIANRSERAVGDLTSALQLACARASSAAGGGAAPSPGAAHGLASIDRIGPHQARSVTGSVQLPLSAIAPLRQGQTPLFVPLVHVTLEGESLPALVRTFVIGTPSPSGRVHPIALDVPPGGIAGLVAQAVAIPPAPAPATAAA